MRAGAANHRRLFPITCKLARADHERFWHGGGQTNRESSQKVHDSGMTSVSFDLKPSGDFANGDLNGWGFQLTMRSEIVPSWIRLGARAAFFVGLCVVVYLSLISADWIPFSDISDKLKHGGAYLVLTLSGAFGFPRTKSFVVIGVVLFALVAALRGRRGSFPDASPMWPTSSPTPSASSLV